MKKFGIVLTLVLVVQLAYSHQAIVVEKSGAGSVLLFLPGFTTPGTVWNETIENLDGNYESHIVSYAGYTVLLKLDLREKLTDIEIPTLIIACSLPDKEVVAANLEKQFCNLKQKEILLVDESKHFIMFDQPEWLYTQLNKYLRSNAR